MLNTTTDVLQRHRFTVAEYHRMAETGMFAPEARVELIEGEIIDMPPIGSPHAGTVDYIADAASVACRGQAMVRVQNPVFLDQHSQPQPDIALLRPRSDHYRSSHPTPADVFLIVEVSDSSLAYDTQIKLPLYARHGIPEVWLADLSNQRFLVHRTPTATGYQDVQTLTDLSAVSPLLLPGVTIDLSDLF
ncbi:MAG: Uma2 family endonuclease [Deltaproteobacteria bacterium]|nr:Uma2 family endonuclease [Deltaproteobacteria bacterium]